MSIKAHLLRCPLRSLLDVPRQVRLRRASAACLVSGTFLNILLLTLPLSAFGGTRIAAIEIENETRVPSDQILSVLPLKVGDPYDPAKAEQALSYLKKWGRFHLVDLEKRITRDGAVLHLTLREGSLISGIDIYGGYPFLSARLRRLITVHSGELYEEALAKEQQDKLKAFYERKGFEGTGVTLDPQFNEKKGTVDLVYRIRKGKRFRLGEVSVSGNTLFPRRYFVSQLNPLLAYEPGRLRRRLEKIRKDYQDKGYLRARIRLKDLRKDPESGKVNPVLEVSEGERVTVVFEGNHRVSAQTFKKIIPMFTEGGYSHYEIQASAEAMKLHYQKLGFQEVAIIAEEKNLEKEGLLVRFVIQEGPQTRVKQIEIEGNREISDRDIKKEFVTKENSLANPGLYEPRLAEQDFQELPQILKNRGALEGKSLSHETTLNEFRDKASLTFNVEEGEITRLSKIEFAGNEHLSSRKLLRNLPLREGQPFSPEKAAHGKDEILSQYANAGYPHAQVSYELTGRGPDAVLVYSIEEGPEVKIGEILIVGNERTSPAAIKRALLLETGEPFSYKKILESESALRRTGSFRSVNIETIGLSEKESEVHLLVRLEEYRRLLLDFGATYDTDDQFTGTLSLSHVNLFDLAKRGILRLTGGRDIQRGEILIKDPNFLGYNFEALLGSHLERRRRPGFETREGGGSFSLLREFTPRLTLLGRYEITRTFFSDVTDATGAAEEDHTTSKFSFSFNYDKRDSFADPQKGFTGFAGLDVSNKLIASTFNFLQPKGYFAYYLKLGKRITLLNFIRAEGIKVFGGDTLTRNERLFLGGDYTVRGFDEDAVGPVGADGRPAGGQLLLAQTTELQVKLIKDFKLALFIDHGSISNDFSDVGLRSFRHSAGFGLRYVTPVGPFRLDYGIKLDRATGESFGRLHLAFGYAF